MTDIKQRDKVAIIGWASSSRQEVPVTDDSFDFWSCNEVAKTYEKVKRWGAHFNLHKKEVIPPANKRWLSVRKEPVILLEKDPEIPNGIVYPFDQVRATFGKFLPQLNKYYTSSIAWKLALAILMDYKEIHLYGVDMAMDSEYQYQRPCCEFFLGFAMGKGVKVYVPKQSDLFFTPWIYSLEDPPKDEGLITMDMIKERIRINQQEINEHTKAACRYEGALVQCQFFQARLAARLREIRHPKAYKYELNTNSGSSS